MAFSPDSPFANLRVPRKRRPPVYDDVFPANAWNIRRFAHYRKIEAFDEEWAPRTERALREVTESYGDERRRIMHVECRSETCVIGIVAWQEPNERWNQWPEIPWTGSTGPRDEPRPDSWREVLYILKRNPRDYPGSSPRVPSFGHPRTNPACAKARPDVSPGDASCLLTVGWGSNALCFDWSKDACACCTSHSAAASGCLLAGRAIRCTVSIDPEDNAFYNE